MERAIRTAGSQQLRSRHAGTQERLSASSTFLGRSHPVSVCISQSTKKVPPGPSCAQGFTVGQGVPRGRSVVSRADSPRAVPRKS